MFLKELNKPQVIKEMPLVVVTPFPIQCRWAHYTPSGKIFISGRPDRYRIDTFFVVDVRLEPDYRGFLINNVYGFSLRNISEGPTSLYLCLADSV
jgi:hypothetical protein